MQLISRVHLRLHPDYYSSDLIGAVSASHDYNSYYRAVCLSNHGIPLEFSIGASHYDVAHDRDGPGRRNCSNHHPQRVQHHRGADDGPDIWADDGPDLRTVH